MPPPKSGKMEEDSKQRSSKAEGCEKPIVLLLVGPPGSGKTTFCNEVIKSARRSWVRICQDNIANGKAGTKSQCLKCAIEALKDGKSVFIDRCNLDREQRSEFVDLGRLHVDVHALVLDLPAKLCISRSVKRTGHEGNLQGGRAAAVVNRMLQKKEFPKLSEGFSRITFCQNENDVQIAVNAYSQLGLQDNLPSGCFGQKNSDTKVQVGIMKFLKKVEAPDKMASDTSNSEITNSVNKITEGRDSLEGSLGGDISCDDLPMLVFPSISTSDFQFNHEKASDIIVDEVEKFLKKVKNVRLALVDLTHGSDILSLVESKVVKRNIDSNRFLTIVGDITRLYTQKGLRCSTIANAANWRLKPGGGGVNAAIFKAAGQVLESATMERAGSLNPGNSVIVPLPPSSPLYIQEGVSHVIHVLGPNMNPQRPNFLNNDYTKGCEVLRKAYSSLFENFASVVRPHIAAALNEISPECKPESSELHKDLGKTRPIDQILNTDQQNSREGCYESDISKKSKGLQSEPISKEASSNVSEPNKSTKKSWGSWAQALHNIAVHPDAHKEGVIEILDDSVVLNDLYPKAKKHILVLARLPGLDSLANVGPQNLQLLKTMHNVGLRWAEKSISEDASLIFRLGYHSVPSMRQLHLHAISQDFDSPHLKNKKHWNSFNTTFFRDSEDVIEEIEKYGKPTLNSESLLSKELRCNKCRSAHPNIPRLKAHISRCLASFPASLTQNGRLVAISTGVKAEA